MFDVFLVISWFDFIFTSVSVGYLYSVMGLLGEQHLYSPDRQGKTLVTYVDSNARMSPVVEVEWTCSSTEVGNKVVRSGGRHSRRTSVLIVLYNFVLEDNNNVDHWAILHQRFSTNFLKINQEDVLVS